MRLYSIANLLLDSYSNSSGKFNQLMNMIKKNERLVKISVNIGSMFRHQKFSRQFERGEGKHLVSDGGTI